MPNHIQNRLEFFGSPDQLSELVQKFSTTYPETEDRAHDKSIICKGPDGEIGWYYETDGIFKRRNHDDVTGMPDGFKKEMVKEWTRFPDFGKVYPVPASVEAVGNISSNIVDAVKRKYWAPISDNSLLGALEVISRGKAKLRPEDYPQFELACKAYEETGYCYWYDFNCDKWGTKWNAYDCEKESDQVYLFQTAWSGVPDIIKQISLAFPEVTIIYEYSDEDTGYNCGIYQFLNGLINENILVGGSVQAYELAFKLRPDNAKYYSMKSGNYVYTEDEDGEDL